MSLLFIWSPANPSPGNKQRFSDTLADQLDTYKEAFGRNFQLQLLEVNSTFIGQIQYDSGIIGWMPWVNLGDKGIAWNGVCEQFLGHTYDERSVNRIADTLTNHPESLREWDGRYNICTWDKQDGSVRITTGATENVTLWYVEGPFGWAIGNRALPLLALVGRQPELDVRAANLYIAYGYLVGKTGLLKGVTRIPSRRQILIKHGDFKIHTYLTFDAYFADAGRTVSWSTIVRDNAERIVERIARQLKHSTLPELMLTGGRDSRCIAAAAVHAGFTGTAVTSGPSNSDDVMIASEVAKILQIEHRNSTSILTPMVSAPKRVRLWMQLNEGMEVVRHAISQKYFFLENFPIPSVMKQRFHGLGGEISRGFYYPKNRDLNSIVSASEACTVIMGHAEYDISHQKMTNELLLEVFSQLANDLNGLPITLAQWLDLFYWQNRCLQWGEDMMAVKDIIDWRWTPLLETHLIRTGWTLHPEEKESSRLIEDMTIFLQPALKSIKYNKQVRSGRMAQVKQAKHIFKQILRTTPFLAGFLPKDRTKKRIGDPSLVQLWQNVFFSETEHVWPELIEPAALNKMLKRPESTILWNLATVELAALALGVRNTTHRFCQK